MASDGRCYGLDFTTDTDINQRFRASANTECVGRSHARIANIEFLLNSKCYSYTTRLRNDRNAKMDTDAREILFVMDYMRRHRIAA